MGESSEESARQDGTSTGFAGLAAQLREWLNEGRGVLVCIDGDVEPPVNPGDRRTMPARASLALSLAYAVDSTWNLRENMVVGAHVEAFVELLEKEEPRMIYVDEGDAMFGAKWDIEARCALEGSRHLVIVSVESIWGFTEQRQAMIDFRLRLSGKPGTTDVFRSSIKEAVGADPYERDRKLGAALLHRSRRLSDTHALERAIDLLRRARSNPRAPEANIEEDSELLASALLDLHALQGDTAALEEATAIARRLLHRAEQDSVAYLFHLTNLVEILGAKAEEYGTTIELDGFLAELEERVSKEVPAGAERMHALGTLAKCLNLKYRICQELEVLNRSVGAWGSAIAAAPKGSSERPSYFGGLALALLDRYDRTGNPEDFSKGKAAIESALRMPGLRPVEVPPLLTALGWVVLEEYDTMGGLSRLQRVIRISRRAARLTHPGSPEYAIRCRNLASVLMVRYRLLQDRKDLDEALSLLRSSIQLVRAGSPDYQAVASTLGIALDELYEITGDEGVREEAIRHQAAAFPSPEFVSPSAFVYVGNMANRHLEKYLKDADLASLDTALDLCNKAIAKAPPGSQLRRQLVSNAATMLRVRYMFRGDLADLETAHLLYAQALKATPESSPSRPGFLANVGMVLLDIHRSTHLTEPLKGAIAAFREALDLSAESAADRPLFLNGLASGLIARYEQEEDPADLEEAIRVLRQAKTGAKNARRLTPMILGNLVGALSHHSEITGSIEEVEEAMDIGKRALELYGPDAPDALGVRLNLAEAMLRHPRSGDDAGFRSQAYSLLEETCTKSAELAPAACLAAADKWLTDAFKRQDWASVARAHEWLWKAGDTILALNPAPRGKRTWLARVQGLSAMACYALAKQGELRLAALALDRGRARLMAETLQAASVRVALGRSRQDLYDRLATIEEMLRHLMQLPAGLVEESQVFDRLANIRSLREERERLLRAARDIPAAGLQVGISSEGDLQAVLDMLPHETALVYIATTQRGTVALLFSPGKHGAIFLPFDREQLANLLVNPDEFGAQEYLDAQIDPNGSVGATLPRLTEKIGAVLMREVANRLRTWSVRMVALIVAGPLALLPLHGARWEEDRKPRCFLEMFATAYAPTARSIRVAMDALGRPGNSRKFVGIGDPDGSLPRARGEVEVVGDLFPPADREILIGSAASPGVVLASASGARYLHFACHGNYRVDLPPASGLTLSGGRLTLQDLLDDKLNLHSARLVALSACQTALTEFLRLPDEFFGLPAGFLSLGVPGVVGTLWSVPDHSTALLMSKFYNHLLARPDSPFAPAVALREAQLWLRDLDRDSLEEYLSSHPNLRARIASATRDGDGLAAWVPTDSRPFSHPYFWAPFVLIGV